MADGAAAFVFELAAAFAAGSLEERPLLHLLLMTRSEHMVPDGLGHRVGAGEDLVFAEARGGMAGDVQ